MNGLFEEFGRLREAFNGKFIITREVKYETIDKPLTIKRFELEALRLKKLFDDKVLELPIAIGIKDEEITKKAEEILNLANNTFMSHKKEMKILDMGETSCLALSKILSSKNIENVLAVDERTMRMLVEKPENLAKLLSKKLHTKIMPKKENFKYFKGFKIIRSAELVYVAYKKGLVNLKNGVVLDALLYAMKYKGCSISGEEIEEIKKIG
jgi:hypothetical protein